MKFKIHSKNISKVVVDNNSVLKPQFMIIDAFYALEGWELTSRTPVKMNLLVSGKDVVTTDATACRVMEINSAEIYHIIQAYKRGLGEMDEDKIETVGSELSEVKR